MLDIKFRITFRLIETFLNCCIKFQNIMPHDKEDGKFTSFLNKSAV